MRCLALVLAATAGAVFAVACPQPGARQQASSATPKPRQSVAGNRQNVLLVTIDTLRADHLGAYGYRRATSPNIDALARRGVSFDQAYTYWPKTRGSFVALHTGRLAAQSGYGKTHPLLVDFNPTLASVLQEAGYDTVAVVDNPNVAASLGYSKGFARYRETWEEQALASEMDRTRAITADARRLPRRCRARAPLLPVAALRQPARPLRAAGALRPGLHWTPRRPAGPVLAPVAGFHGGVPRQWAHEGRRLGWYVAQYDGEIAAVDAEVGRVLQALAASPVKDQTLVVLSSDHGESLGEHDYFFDHGENLFDPSMRVPLLVAGPGIEAGRRSQALATTLDLVPTLLDALKVSYPPDLAGVSLLGAARGEAVAGRARLAGPERPQPARGLGRPLQDRGDALRRAARATRSSTGRRTRARRGTSRARSRRRCEKSGASWSCSVRGSTRSWLARAACSKGGRVSSG